MASRLKPFHYSLQEYYTAFIDNLYVSFNGEADAHEAHEQRTLDVMKKIKSGEIALDQIEVTDNAWEIMPALMTKASTPDISKTSPNGATEEAKKEGAKKDAVSATSRK